MFNASKLRIEIFDQAGVDLKNWRGLSSSYHKLKSINQS
jgi:hypothetical protein